jgi:hypothetical protein
MRSSHTGVAAWGIALLALAARRAVRWPVVAAVGSGLVLGWGIFLNYGLALMAMPAVAVLIAALDWRSAMRALVPAVLAALAVVGVFAAAGFWWFDGYTLVQERYWQGIANDRPFQYWLRFTVWLAAAGALLPPRSQRWWLALNVVGALLLNHLILTNW